MQTDAKTITTEDAIAEALSEFKEADKAYNDATAAVRSYAYKNAGRTATVEFALLQAKVGELGLARNAKLVAWSNSKKSGTSTVRPAVRLQKICSQCGAIDLMVPISGGTRCNQCGFQA